MLFISKFFRVFFVISLIASLSVLTFADTIRLKDGRIVKGKIVSFDGGRFTVMFDDGTRQRQMVYSADEVESIAFDSGSVAANNVKISNSVPNNTSNNGDNTVIAVGQTNKTSSPQTTSPKANPTTPTQTASPITPKPISINVKVLADSTSNGWTNSGWVVRQGQKIKITGNGNISLGGGRTSTPAGNASLPDTGKLIKTQPTGGLIAVIGDDNNDFIYVGNSVEFVAPRDGALFLGINEGNLDDNTGTFDVKIEIFPEIGS